MDTRQEAWGHLDRAAVVLAEEAAYLVTDVVEIATAQDFILREREWRLANLIYPVTGPVTAHVPTVL
jgi:hypothetical protein